MGINRVILLIASCMVIALHVPVLAQFVTLEGKDFKLDGEDFYPMALNYSVLLTRSNAVVGQPAPSDIYFAPDASFGPSAEFDCLGEANCKDRLLTDFQKVRDMGFNTVRVVAGFELGYRDTPEHGADERRFSMDIYQNPFPDNNHDANHVWVNLESNVDGPYAERFFELVNGVLDVAEQAGLKVILLPAGPGERNPDENRRYMYPTFDQHAVDDYANYLAHLAEAIQDHPALLAYDIFNEPQYNSLEYQQCSLPNPNAQLGEVRICGEKWRKEDICAFTDQWYTAIKQHDPDHLVTLGGLGLYELEVWDMGALHLDFYSVHIYPGADYRGSWNDPQGRARLQAELYWFGQECPMPWIIGEIGYSANDDEEPPHTGIGPQYHQYPYMDGTEADQADFVQWSLDLTRQYGGSGWSWWYFQEFRWWEVYYPTDAYLHPGNMRGIYYALLKPGDANNDYYDKLAVPVVQSYSPAPMPETPAPPPANYYNWDNLPGPVSYSGTIKDQYNQPIENAQAWLRLMSVDDPSDLSNVNFYETFHAAPADASGAFSFNTEPAGTGYLPPTPSSLIIVARGANTTCYAPWENCSSSSVPSSGTTFHLECNPFEFDGAITGLELYTSNGDPAHRFAGWSDLQVQDVVIHGTPNPGTTHYGFVARRSVHLRPGFHAAQGSDVHIHTEETFPDCGDPSYHALLVSPETGMANAVPLPRQGASHIELRFEIEMKQASRVVPNPFTKQIEVYWDGGEPARIELMDALGHLLGTWSAQGPTATLDLGHLAPGPYFLRVTHAHGIISHQIIKQP